jgi:phage baseplate assembly protein W
MATSSLIQNKVVVTTAPEFTPDLQPIQYIGFNTQDPTSTTFSLYDVDLIKQDVLNHFNTRKGAKLMNPEFGSILWDMIFEPFTAENKALIVADVNSILRSDPRFVATEITITPEYDKNSLTIDALLTVLPYNVSTQLQVMFDTQGAAVV